MHGHLLYISGKHRVHTTFYDRDVAVINLIYRGYLLEKNQTSKYICIGIALLLLNLFCLYLFTHDVSETVGLILTIAMILILPILIFVVKYVIHNKN